MQNPNQTQTYEEPDKSRKLAVHELLPWETNQSVAALTGAPLEYIRKARIQEQRHNRHDVDDLELGNQEW